MIYLYSSVKLVNRIAFVDKQHWYLFRYIWQKPSLRCGKWLGAATILKKKVSLVISNISFARTDNWKLLKLMLFGIKLSIEWILNELCSFLYLVQSSCRSNFDDAQCTRGWMQFLLQTREINKIEVLAINSNVRNIFQIYQILPFRVFETVSSKLIFRSSKMIIFSNYF